MRLKRALFFLTLSNLILTLSGCTSTPGVIPTGNNSYMIMISGQSGFVPLGGMKADAYKEAHNYCLKQNKTLKPIDYNSVTAGFARFPQVELKFECITEKEQKETPN